MSTKWFKMELYGFKVTYWIVMHTKTNTKMNKYIPTLEGDDAEEFIRKADENVKLMRQTNDFLSGVGKWHSLDVQPPDELVEVQDENGNIAKAYPTYYPFKLGEKKTGRKWGNSYWDGGWMIECQGLESNIDSGIVRWRACC